jgi:hypothetical protein
MNLISRTILVLGLVSSALCLPAQQAFFNIGAGYSFRNAAAPMAGFYNNTLNQNSYTESQILLSLGSGISAEGGLILYGGDYLGFTLKYSHLFSQKTHSLEVSNVSVATKELTNTITGSFNRIEPLLILRGEGNLIVPYMQFGPVISFGKASWSQLEDLGLSKNTNAWEFTGGISTGFTASFGFTYEIGALAHLFVEANGYSLSWAPEKKTMTESKVSGKDVMPDLPIKVKFVEYVDERTFDYGNPPPDTQPDLQLKYTIPMSSFGLKMGLRIEL